MSASDLVPLEVQRSTVLGRVAPLEPIELSLLEALGCVAAEDVVVDTDLPPFASSGMDGYAVVAADADPGATLVVVGEVAAGATTDLRVGGGRSVRIMTGAPIPPGADAVVPVEDVEESSDGTIRVTRGVGAGDAIRPAGQDVAAGTTVVTAGTRMDAAHLGMAAMAGRGRLSVHPRPRVVVIATGDELVEPGAPTERGQIRDSNSVMLTAMAREAGADAVRNPIVRDDRRALLEALEGALPRADLLVTSGGVSAGRYDYVKDVLAQLGDVVPTKVAMQPGKPQAFGIINHGGRAIPAFGLPGNPVSSFVSFEVFVRPALRRLQGRTDLDRPRVTAVAASDLSSPGDRVSFLRVRLTRDGRTWHAEATGHQGSGLLGSVARAHGLAEVPREVTSVPVGDEVLVHLLVEP